MKMLSIGMDYCEKIVFSEALNHLKAVDPGSAFAFDADPDAFSSRG